jgi:hypothetical protein
LAGWKDAEEGGVESISEKSFILVHLLTGRLKAWAMPGKVQISTPDITCARSRKEFVTKSTYQSNCFGILYSANAA